MDHMPMTWEERGRLWLRLGLRGILLLGEIGRASCRERV